jgi:KaiC/GvpD/RAD55 family RecA-like ATPase
MDCSLPDFCWKRIILARGTNLSSFCAFQYLIISCFSNSFRDSLSLDIWPATRQKEDCANTFGEQVTTRIFRILAKSVFVFVFEVGALVLGYYAYLAWNGVSVTGSIVSDILLPVSLVMMFGLNVAVVSRLPANVTDETSPNSDTSITAGVTKKEQALKFLKVLGSLSSSQLASLLEIDVRNLSKFINPFIQTGIIAAKKEGKTYIYSLKNPHNLLLTHNRHTPQEETEYASVTLPKWNIQLPSEGNVLGRLALDDWKLGDFVYLPLTKYAQKGILVSGASGSGKTIAAKVIVEELLQDRIPVVVFDYTRQWERLFEKNTDEGMLEKYRLFGMRGPKAFKGDVVKELPDISKTLQIGEGTIVDLSSVSETDERVGQIATALDQILEYFQTQEDSQHLRFFLVIEEAHLWISKEVPKDAATFLDRVVRLLRKKGVGVMLVSHKISDFDTAMRSSMNISIVFRTKYEGDLDSISRTLGSEFSKIVPSMPVGCSVFHSADLGDPFVIDWRPLYSQA